MIPTVFARCLATECCETDIFWQFETQELTWIRSGERNSASNTGGSPAR